MRAAIYARYSSDLQRDASIEDQVRACRSHVDAERWELVATYTDHGVSGASRLRPGYQKLLEDARISQFEIVIAEALDRLSRDQEDVAGLFKHLMFLGVSLFTLAEGEITELHVGLTGTMNALFLKNLAQKTRRGLEGRVRKGRSAGGCVYGYSIVRELTPSGDPVRGGRCANEAEAAVVRRIYHEFAVGKSPMAIARGLNAEGITGPGGRPWQGSTISGHSRRRNGILRNETYVGRLVWNRQRFIKDPITGRRVARLNAQSAWVIEDVPELRIIDDATWNAVAARLDATLHSQPMQKRLASRFWEKRRPGYMLTSLVCCRSCGSPFTSVGGDYLACSAARKMGTCPNRRGITRQVLDGLVLDTLKQHLMHPDLVQEFITAFTVEVNRQRREQEGVVEQQRRELTEVSRRLNGLIDAIADGLRTPGLKQRLEAMEQEKLRLEQAISAAPPPAPRLHPRLASLYQQKVAELEKALDDPALRDEALGTLRGLIERVELAPTPDGFEIEFIGEIANMMALSCPGESREINHFRISAKRVAGARNHREIDSAGLRAL